MSESLPPGIPRAEFEAVRDLLLRTCSFVLEPGKAYLLETRLAELAARRGFPTVVALLTQLRIAPTPDLERDVVEALLNGETLFFRDIHCFDALRKVVIPRLLELRAATKRLDIWCGACSTGQEAWSLAMMLDQLAAPLSGWTVRLLATDVSRRSVERARGGRYAQAEINRGLPAPMLIRHFQQDGVEWVVQDRLRSFVEFQEFNLKSAWLPLGGADIVLLRNVMIYWSESDACDLLRRVRQVLRPDGCLVLGGAETTMFLDRNFERWSDAAPCCFKVRPEPPGAR